LEGRGAQHADVLDVLQLRRVTQELVAVSFTLYLPQDINTVVVSEGAGHLVIVHAEVVLLDAPEPRQSWWVHDLEHACLSVLPGNIP